MSATTLSILCTIVVVLICTFIYNSLIGKRNQAENAFATIDVMLKKRYDLIPSLVTVVKQYAAHEKELFAQIAETRSKNYADMSDSDKMELDKSFGQASEKLMIIAESYPELKASDNFMQLQRAINETEEQLSAARRAYNAAVTDYNNKVESFPSNLIAGLFKFSRKNVYTYNHE
ncbi:LemA family protein [Parabacteroides chinchillae]|uniref:LemA protein n=1 Tax=Parabacteroides chinchillae TaxID=871327 RepID=A0A8G2BVQ1_9BACT|nr:LemA family protein [Parabacteroides chinchillae]SEF76188.1 LemA protein [Parabacteroides chinchillae]